MSSALTPEDFQVQADDDGSLDTFTAMMRTVRLPTLHGVAQHARQPESFHCRGEHVDPMGGGTEVYLFRGRRWKRID